MQYVHTFLEAFLVDVVGSSSFVALRLAGMVGVDRAPPGCFVELEL